MHGMLGCGMRGMRDAGCMGCTGCMGCVGCGMHGMLGCGMRGMRDARDAGCGMRDARDAVAAVAIEFAMGFKLRKKCDLKSSLVLPFPSHSSCCLSRIPLSLVCPLLLHIPAHAVWPDWHHT